MIVAAGLGTRLLPLTGLRPKPALPVRVLPLVAYNLALLAHHRRGVRHSELAVGEGIPRKVGQALDFLEPFPGLLRTPGLTVLDRVRQKMAGLIQIRSPTVQDVACV